MRTIQTEHELLRLRKRGQGYICVKSTSDGSDEGAAPTLHVANCSLLLPDAIGECYHFTDFQEVLFWLQSEHVKELSMCKACLPRETTMPGPRGSTIRITRGPTSPDR